MEKYMLLSERSQSEKAKHYNSDYMSFCKRQTGGREKKKKSVLASS